LARAGIAAHKQIDGGAADQRHDCNQASTTHLEPPRGLTALLVRRKVATNQLRKIDGGAFLAQDSWTAAPPAVATSNIVMLDVARFVGTTGLIALAGAGVSACLRVPFDAGTRVLLGAAFGQALWAIALGTGVSMGLPVKAFAHWLWATTAVLSMIGAWQLRRDRTRGGVASRRLRLVFIVVSAVPVLVMSPYFRHGLAEYPGSGLPDGWAYVAYGQYLWDFPRGTEGGLAPLYQYASTLSSTRSIASAQLGALSLLREAGEVQTGFGLLQAVGLAAYAAAAAAFASSAGLGAVSMGVTITVTVMSGWILNVLWANNLDNLLALAYAPALAVLSAWPRPDRTGWWLASAWLAAGLLHTYPELGLVILPCAALVAVVSRSVPEKYEDAPGGGSTSHALVRRWIVAGVAVVLLVGLMPPARDLIQLLRGRLHAATALDSPRPGEGLFSGLIVPRHVLAGWWGLGSEHAYERLLIPRTLVAAALLVLLVAGARALVRERRTAWLIWLALPIGLAPLLAAIQGYPYGAYKAILMGWWFVAFLVVRGSLVLTAWRPRMSSALIVWLVVAALPAAATARLLFMPVSRSFRMPRPASMTIFRQVREVESTVGSDPLLVAVRDEEASEWAAYHLRHLTVLLLTLDRYIVPKAAAMARAQPVDLDRVRWVLVDAPAGPAASSSGVGSDWTLRWRGGPYALWETPPGAGRSLEAEFAAGR
jgi:hypothetical protein